MSLHGCGGPNDQGIDVQVDFRIPAFILLGRVEVGILFNSHSDSMQKYQGYETTICLFFSPY